jgi:hypothetical protein
MTDTTNNLDDPNKENLNIEDDTADNDNSSEPPSEDPRDIQIRNLNRALRKQREEVKRLKASSSNTERNVANKPNSPEDLDLWKAKAEDYEEYLSEHLEREKSKLPQKALSLLPSNLSVKDQLEWVSNAYAVFAESTNKPEDSKPRKTVPKGIVNPSGNDQKPAISREEFAKLPITERVKYLNEFTTRDESGQIRRIAE